MSRQLLGQLALFMLVTAPAVVYFQFGFELSVVTGFVVLSYIQLTDLVLNSGPHD